MQTQIDSQNERAELRKLVADCYFSRKHAAESMGTERFNEWWDACARAYQLGLNEE